MLSYNKRDALEKHGKKAKAVAHNSGAYVVYYGLNWVSVVAPYPFRVTAASVTSSDSAATSTARAPTRRHQQEEADGDREESAEALVAAQLPRAAIATSATVLKKALPACETLQAPPHAPLPAQKCFVASLWCLHPSTTYTVALVAETSANREAVAAASATSSSSSSSSATQLTVRTPDFNLPLDLHEEALHLVERGALLFHPEFVNCITAQGSSRLLFYLPSNLLDARTALPFMHAFWYHGLFTLPESVPLSWTNALLFFMLPNGAERFVLDLVPAQNAENNTERKLMAASAAGLNEEAGATVQHDCGLETVSKSGLLYPWRGHSRVRRVIRSGMYTVIVRDDVAGVQASLRRAYDYHMEHNESTWLSPVFIRLMGSCCSSDRGEKANNGSPSSPQQNGAFGVRLVCVELVDEAAAEVVAGCCGMAIGSVYHDYTMYTLRQCKDSLGSFLTKLLGEALQRCGYTLWYWGFRLGYMADYEKHFGAVNMPRAEFYHRWCAARDVEPACAVEDFLRASRGMVPHTSRTL